MALSSLSRAAAVMEALPVHQHSVRISSGPSIPQFTPMKLRILMLHNRYLIRGGEDESTDLEASMLLENGHEVDLLELNNRLPVGLVDKAQMAVNSVWSNSSKRLVADRLSSSRYDIVHVQNFFPLFSPAVYTAAHQAGVPVVQAVRNYRLVCPSANLFRDGQFCDDCVGKSVAYPGILHGCYRSSRLGTASIVAMQSFNRALGQWQRGVDRYVAITHFVRQQLVRGGFPEDKIVVKPNFVKLRAPSELLHHPSRDFALSVGRLTEDKGAHWLVQNWERANLSLPLRLVGERDISGKPLPPLPRTVDILGKKPLETVYQLMAQARFVVLPSLWPEPFGRTVVEAFANGTPVLAANSGGVSELVDDGHTGFLYDPTDMGEFAEKAHRLSNDSGLVERMGQAARQVYEERYSAKANYAILSSIYSEVLRNPTTNDRACGLQSKQIPAGSDSRTMNAGWE